MNVGDITVGEAAEMFRKAEGLSVREMAKRCGMSPHYYYTRRKPSANPRIRQIWELLHVIGVTIEAMTTCEERPPHYHVVSPAERGERSTS